MKRLFRWVIIELCTNSWQWKHVLSCHWCCCGFFGTRVLITFQKVDMLLYMYFVILCYWPCMVHKHRVYIFIIDWFNVFSIFMFLNEKKIVEWYNDVYSSLTATSHGAVPRNIFLRRNSSVYDRDVKWTFILHLPISEIRITDIDNSINRYRWFKTIFPYKCITLFSDIGNSIFRYWKITLIYRNRKIELPISVNNFDFPILVNQSIYR